VAVSSVFAKTLVRQFPVSGGPNFIIPTCSLIQVTLCGTWLGTSPPFIDTDAHSEHGHMIMCPHKFLRLLSSAKENMTLISSFLNMFIKMLSNYFLVIIGVIAISSFFTLEYSLILLNSYY
jgi:hypothetical protein